MDTFHATTRNVILNNNINSSVILVAWESVIHNVPVGASISNHISDND